MPICTWHDCGEQTHHSRHCRDHQTRPTETLEAGVIQVVRTISMVGTGIDTEDPVRRVTTYWDFEGNKLASSDPTLKQEEE